MKRLLPVMWLVITLIAFGSVFAVAEDDMMKQGKGMGGMGQGQKGMGGMSQHGMQGMDSMAMDKKMQELQQHEKMMEGIKDQNQMMTEMRKHMQMMTDMMEQMMHQQGSATSGSTGMSDH